MDLEVQPNKILALDQASRVTGYSIFEDGKLIDHGHFEANEENLGERLCHIRDKVELLIKENNIDYVIFEDIQHQSNVANNLQTFKVLAEVFGVIWELVTEMEIPNSQVLSVTWKSIVGIKGKSRQEQKKNAQEFVRQTYAVDCTQDEADAICIGTYALYNFGQN